MAFSIRKMLSNIYFKKPDSEINNDENIVKEIESGLMAVELDEGVPQPTLENLEPDSTSRNTANLPESVKRFVSEGASSSDTENNAKESPSSKKVKRRVKKLKLDVEKANKCMNQAMDALEQPDVHNSDSENTPKYISLRGEDSLEFRERLKHISQSYDLLNSLTDAELDNPPDDIQSLSEHSDSDTSVKSEKSGIKMCRKISVSNQNICKLKPDSPEPFADVELDSNDNKKSTVLSSYKIKLQDIENALEKLLTEFQFHIEVSRIFRCKSIVTMTGSNPDIPKILDDQVCNNRPAGQWDIVMEQEDMFTRNEFKKQLIAIKQLIENFANVYLQNHENIDSNNTKRNLKDVGRSLTYNVQRGSKRVKVNTKKRIKRENDFPDLSEEFYNLFSVDGYILNNLDAKTQELDQCNCKCHCGSDSDSVISKSDEDKYSQTISSSIGNFSLDSTTLTAFSETLDLVISCSSFDETNIFTLLLQKSAIERITFYVQVHGIQIQSDPSDNEPKYIQFNCPACSVTFNEEKELLSHLLNLEHCEKIHFVYKTAYIKKCFAAGKEIQPSTVLNPMTTYRDENKIICFGDAVYACTLCFENLIVGESVLIAHCYDPNHIERKRALIDLADDIYVEE